MCWKKILQRQEFENNGDFFLLIIIKKSRIL